MTARLATRTWTPDGPSRREQRTGTPAARPRCHRGTGAVRAGRPAWKPRSPESAAPPSRSRGGQASPRGARYAAARRASDCRASADRATAASLAFTEAALDDGSEIPGTDFCAGSGNGDHTRPV